MNVIAARSKDYDAALLESLGRKLLDLAKEVRRDGLSSAETAQCGVVARGVLAVMTGEAPTHGAEEAKARSRETLLDLCKAAGRMARPPNGIPADVSAVLVARAYGEREPVYRTLAAENVTRIRALVEAHRNNTGGRGNKGAEAETRAVEELCDAMGYAADRATIRRTARRRSKRAGRNPKG